MVNNKPRIAVATLQVRLRPEHKVTLLEAAKREGVSLSVFMVRAGLDRAKDGEREKCAR